MSNVAVLGFTDGDAFFGNGGGKELLPIESATLATRGGGNGDVAFTVLALTGETGGNNTSSSTG